MIVRRRTLGTVPLTDAAGLAQAGDRLKKVLVVGGLAWIALLLFSTRRRF